MRKQSPEITFGIKKQECVEETRGKDSPHNFGRSPINENDQKQEKKIKGKKNLKV
jgi:hypothetical protein